MTLRTRFLLALCGLSLFAAGIVSFQMVMSERTRMKRAFSQSKQTNIVTFAQIAQDALIAQNDLALINYLEILKRLIINLELAEVVSPGGLILAHTDPNKIGSPSRKLEDEDEYNFSRKLTMHDQYLGNANLIFSKEQEKKEYDKRHAFLIKKSSIALIASLVLSIFGAHLLAKQLTGPISKIGEVIAEISSGKLESRLPKMGKGELGKLADEVNQMAVKLGQLEDMKKDFLSGVSHDLRSPIAALNSITDFMLDQEELAAEHKESCAMIKTNAQQLQNMVDDLLQSAKTKIPLQELKLKALQPKDMIARAIKLMEHQVSTKKILVHAAISRTLPPLFLDEQKILRVMQNLIGNAVRHTPQGGLILITAARENGHVAFSINDNGDGIPREILPSLFGKFVKGRKGGLGLGLFAAKSIVEAHNGKIWASNNPKKGATFSFTIPVKMPRTDPA
ncbi:ATP-binding protein [Elusimicrobiota bacterium]